MLDGVGCEFEFQVPPVRWVVGRGSLVPLVDRTAQCTDRSAAFKRRIPSLARIEWFESTCDSHVRAIRIRTSARGNRPTWTVPHCPWRLFDSLASRGLLRGPRLAPHDTRHPAGPEDPEDGPTRWDRTRRRPRWRSRRRPHRAARGLPVSGGAGGPGGVYRRPAVPSRESLIL